MTINRKTCMKNHHKERGVTMYIVNKEISLLEYLEG